MRTGALDRSETRTQTNIYTNMWKIIKKRFLDDSERDRTANSRLVKIFPAEIIVLVGFFRCENSTYVWGRKGIFFPLTHVEIHINEIIR